MSYIVWWWRKRWWNKSCTYWNSIAEKVWHFMCWMMNCKRFHIFTKWICWKKNRIIENGRDLENLLWRETYTWLFFTNGFTTIILLIWIVIWRCIDLKWLIFFCNCLSDCSFVSLRIKRRCWEFVSRNWNFHVTFPHFMLHFCWMDFIFSTNN